MLAQRWQVALRRRRGDWGQLVLSDPAWQWPDRPKSEAGYRVGSEPDFHYLGAAQTISSSNWPSETRSGGRSRNLPSGEQHCLGDPFVLSLIPTTCGNPVPLPHVDKPHRYGTERPLYEQYYFGVESVLLSGGPQFPPIAKAPDLPRLTSTLPRRFVELWGLLTDAGPPPRLHLGVPS